MQATFCFVDLAGYSALTEVHGDATAIDLIDRFVELVGQSQGRDDRLVKTIGDAVFLTFASPDDAIGFVVRLWKQLGDEANFPEARIGLHEGQAIERNDDVFGADVNLAARVASQARGGEVLATKSVAEAAERAGIAVTTRGPVRLKNLREPVELYALDVGREVPAWVVDPVCRMRLDPRNACGNLHFGGTTYWFCSLRCCSLFASAPETYAGGTP